MTDLVIRPLEPGEAELFLSYDDPGLVGAASTGRDFRTFWDKREYRPEWTWVALRGGAVVGRAAWWGGPEDTEPHALDWFDVVDPEVGVRLLREATPRTDFVLLLPPGWRDDPIVRTHADLRIDAARRAGMTPLVERLHYTWTPTAGLPERTGRLDYRPEPDDDVILDVVSTVHSVTRDAHARRTIATRGLDAAARDELEFFRWMPSPREWWRLAYTPDGDRVGIMVPGRNYGGPIIGFVGVVPEHRGHSYGFDLLVEATHLLVAEGVDRITAETDVGNVGMAAAFARAGYPITQERVYLEW